MKAVCNISQHFKKILIMLLLVAFLAACGADHKEPIGDACTDASSSESMTCIDVNDISCLGCKIFKQLFNAASVNIMKMHGQLTSGALSLMMVCFSVWLSFRLLKFVSSVSESSISQIWNEITKQGFLCLFCGILASSPEMLIYAINTFIYPIYATFLKFGIAIMETSISNSDGSATSFRLYGTNVSVAGIKLVCSFDKSGLITKDGFPQEFSDTIICMIKVLKGYLTIGGSIARELMSQSSSFIGWIAGAILFVLFLVVRIGFIFYLVDTIFQMGIIILLLPIFIMAYAFEATRKWTKIGIENIIASAGFLMCFSMIVTMVLRAMVELIANNPSLFDPSDAQKDISNIGLGFLCLLLIGFLIYGSMGVTQQITGSLVGASVDAKFQENLVKAANKAKGWALKGLGAMVTFGMALMPATVQETIQDIQEARKKIRRMAGREKE